jgi:hypothetical protein
MTNAEIILSVFMAVLTILSTFAIPWAFKVSNKLTVIDTKLTNGLTDKVQEHGARIYAIEMTCNRNHPDRGPRMIDG